MAELKVNSMPSLLELCQQAYLPPAAIAPLNFSAIFVTMEISTM
jgi:hypothetical protein